MVLPCARMRRKMFDVFTARIKLADEVSVLDVGATLDRRSNYNLFEGFYIKNSRSRVIAGLKILAGVFCHRNTSNKLVPDKSASA